MSERKQELFEAVKQDPTDQEASAQLLALLEGQEDWGGLAELHLFFAQVATQPEARSQALVAAADVTEQRLGDPMRTAELLVAAIEGAGEGAVELLQRLRKILVSLEAWEDLLRVGEELAARTPAGAERAQLFYSLGEQMEILAQNGEFAVRCYQAAFTEDPQHAEAFQAARHLYEGAENWEMVARLLDLELQSSTEPERRGALLADLSKVLVEPLQEYALAQQALQELVALNPEDADSRERLAQVTAQLGEAPESAEAAPESAEVESAEATPESAEPESAEPESAEATPESAEAEPETPSEAPAEVAQDEQDEQETPEPMPPSSTPPEAQPPVDPSESSQPPAEIPAAAGERVAQLRAQLEGASQADRLDLLIELAGALKAEGPIEALPEVYLEAAALEPGDLRIYWQVGSSLKAPQPVLEAIAQGLAQALTQAEPEYAPSLEAHGLVFAASALGDDKGVDFKLRDLAKKSGDPLLDDWQIQRLIEGDKWRNVQQILTKRIGGDPAKARVASLREMAELSAQRVGDPAKTADFWRQVLLADRDDDQAQEALLVLYPQLERWKEYVDLLSAQVEKIPTSQADEKLAGLRKLVEVHAQHVGADQKLVGYYQQILDLDPTDAAAMAVLVEKYEEMRKWPDLVQILQRQSAAAQDDAERIEINLRIAEVYLEKFRNRAEAAVAYETVLADDPENRTALEALDGLYEKNREWDQLVDVRRRLADLAPSEAERVEAYKALAEYATQRIRRGELSLSLWEEVRGLVPEDLDALRVLVGLYEQDKRYEEMVEAAQQLVGLGVPDAEQVDLLQRAGLTLQDRLDDKPKAVEVWRQLLQIDPEHRRAGDSLKKALIELSDWDGLEAFFAQTEKYDELVRILESQVGAQNDDETRADLLFRAADVWLDRLEQQDRAVRALERVRQLDPQNQRAALKLEPIYTELADHRKLAEVLEVLLGYEEEPEQRHVYMGRLSELCEAHLRNPEGAFEWLRKRLEEIPGTQADHAELERLGAAVQQWPVVHDDLVQALGQIMAGAPVDGEGESEAVQRDLLLRIARILDEELGAQEEALQRYHEVLDLEPENRTALDAIELLYMRAANWTELLTVLDRKIALAEDDQTRIELLRKQAVLYEQQLEDAWSAVERHRAILEIDGEDRPALEALAQLFTQGEQYEELHGVLSQELTLVEAGAEGDATALRTRIGLIELGQLGRVEEAIARFEAILAELPAHEAAREALESLLDEPEVRQRVAGILEPIYLGAEDYAALVRALEIQLEETEEAEPRVALLARIGELHIEKLGDLEQAFEAFARLLREDPSSELALERLTALAEATDRFGDLAQLIESILPGLEEQERAHSLLCLLAQIYDERLEDLPSAIDARRRALEIAADDLSSIVALESLYQRTEQYTDLLQVLRQKHELAEEDEARLALLFQIAELLETLIGEPTEAITVYREILEASPENHRALEALDRLLTQEERWPELVEVLTLRQTLAGDASEGLGFQVRIAELYELALGNYEQAIETLRAVLEVEPLSAPVVEALERIVQDPGYRDVAVRLLEPIYEAQELWPNLIWALEIQCEEAEEDADRIALLHRIATLHLEKGADGATAFQTYARAFQIDPANAETLTQLEALAEGLEAWDSLVQVYQDQVNEIADVEVATDVHKRAARVLVQRLGDLETGRTHYEAALFADETDAEVLGALEAIYTQTEQWAQLVGILNRQADLTEEVPEQKALLFRMSALYEDFLGDAERAIETYLRVRSIDEQDLQALNALERIYQGLERWDELIEVLEKKVSLQEDLAERKALQTQVGAIWEEALGDLSQAVEAHQRILSWDAEDLDALQALDRLYQQLENWGDLLENLAQQEALAAEQEARHALRYRIAKVHEEQLDDVEAALEGYEQILKEDAGHVLSMEALWGLVRADREPQRAAALLEPVLTGMGAWDEQVAVWRDLLAVTAEPEARTALLMRIGQAQEEMLADSDQAFATYGEALNEDCGHEPALEALERVAGLAGLWEPLVEALGEVLPKAESDEALRGLYVRMARILEVELGDNERAIESLRAVLELNPEDLFALQSLDRLYQKQEAWSELVEVLHRLVDLAEDAEKIPLLLRAGGLYEVYLDQITQAIEAYRSILLIEPGQADAIAQLESIFAGGAEQPAIGEILEPLYVERADWERLHGLLQALLAHQLPGDDRMRAMHRLAQLCLEELEDEGRGFEWYGYALREVPEDELSRSEVARLAESTGRYPELVAAYSDAMQHTQDIELLRDYAHELAKIYRERLDDDQAAEQMYSYVLEHLDAEDVKALAGLDELYVLYERWADLASVLEREIQTSFEVEQRIDLLYRLGQVRETHLGDIEGAAECYRDVLEIEPLHPATLERLEQIYLAQQADELLYDIYARKVENAQEDAERATLKVQMAELAHGLGQPDDAIGLYNEVLELSGEQPAVLAALEQVYFEEARWQDLVEACERQLPLAEDDVQQQIGLYARLGWVWAEQLGQDEVALENWGKVLQLDPVHFDGLTAMRILYQRTQQDEPLAQIDHRLLDVLSPQDETRVEIFRELGQLYQSSLEQPAQAIEAWVQILAYSSHDPEAIDALEDLYVMAEDWSSSVEILDRKVEITEDPYDQVSLLFRIAQMYEQHLEAPAGAQEALTRVLAIQPDNMEAYDQLERLYEAGEQWEELVGTQLARLEQTTDAYERLDAFERISRVFEERLGVPENGLLVLGQAFEESRDDERFGAHLDRLAGLAEKWPEAVTMYENVIAAMGNVPESIPLHLRVARWYDEHLDQAQHAGTHYQHVLAIEEDNLPALTALEALLERYQNWPKVVEVLVRKVELLTEPEERSASLRKLAQIYEHHLGQSDAAVAAYEEVVQIDGGDLEVLRALEGLYMRQHNWQALIDVLERQTGLLEDPQSIVENYLRAGEMWETRMNSAERAIEAYHQALAADETSLPALQSLEKLYRGHSRWHDLLDIYDLMLRVRTAPQEQLGIYSQIALVQEQELQDYYATVETYDRMLRVAPESSDAMYALDRLYRQAEQWTELTAAYEQHLAVLEDPAQIIPARLALAGIYREQLGELAQATAVLEPVLEYDPQHRETLEQLGQLYEAQQDWERCIDAYARLAHLIQDRVALLDLQCRIGYLYQEHLQDYDSAQDWFQSALEHNPSYLPALDALQGLYAARGEWMEVVRVRKMMEAASRPFPEKSQHLFAIGQVYDQHLNDRLTAIDFYEQAIDLYPENLDAAAPLVEVYWADGRWERVEPLLTLIIEQQGQGMDPRALQDLHFRLGYAADQLHLDEKALTHYRYAYELDSTHLPTLEGMGELLYRHEDWDRAFKIFQTILVHHRDGLPNDQLVNIFFRQGGIKMKQGDTRKAQDFFRKVLEVDPQHVATLEALTALHEGQGEWQEAIYYRRHLQALLTDPTQRFQSFVQLGTLYQERLGDVHKAVEVLQQALEIEPTSRVVLSKLLGIYQAESAWPEAADVLIRLAELDTDIGRKSKYYFTAAVVQRDYLKDYTSAVRTFDKALDVDPTELKAFRALDEILTSELDFERQDRYWRKMLMRASERGLDNASIVQFAMGLGEINRSRLNRNDDAIKAYNIALSRAPERPDLRFIIAELYVKEGRTDKAIAQYYQLIELDPRNIEAYRHLRRLFYESQRYDEAWCVCQVLTVLGEASPDEQAFFEKYRSRSLTSANRPLDRQHWGLIIHPDMSLPLGRLFQRLYRYTAPHMVRTHKELGLHKRKSLVAPTDETPFNKVINEASKTSRLLRPEVFRAPAGQLGMKIVNLNPPALVVGADLQSGRSLQELAFICGKTLFLTGESYVMSTFDDTYERRKATLMTMVYTIMQLLMPEGQLPAQPDLLAHYQLIPPVDLEELRKTLQVMRADQAAHLNVSRWLEAVEYTANRLGFLLANDVQSALQVIRNEPGTYSRATAEDRLKDIISFALSENYFQLRKALGLAIG